MEPTAYKPGIQTTEFWAQLTAQIINLLVGLNLISSESVPSIETTVSKIIATAILICTNAVVVIHYVDGRLSLKRSKGTSAGPSGPSPAPAIIALIVAGLVFSTAGTANAAWPPKFSLTFWRTNQTKKLEEIKGQLEQHDNALRDHDAKILDLKLGSPKQPPAGEQPQRLSNWEPALFRLVDAPATLGKPR